MTTTTRSRLRTAWCVVTFRHTGRIDHDARGVYWQCRHCGHRMYATDWEAR